MAGPPIASPGGGWRSRPRGAGSSRPSRSARTCCSEPAPRAGVFPASSSCFRGSRSGMSWIDPDFPRTAEPTDLVARVLGLNPGMLTGPGTNTYLVGRRRPILIDTGAGVPEYVPLFADYLGRRGWKRPERIVITHRHRD